MSYEKECQSISVRSLIAEYPHPVKGSMCWGIPEYEEYGEYCVGGAFCLWMDLQPAFPEVTGPEQRFSGFPDDDRLSRYLAVATGQARQFLVPYAEAILTANDEGLYGEAWMFLQNALERRHTAYESLEAEAIATQSRGTF